MQRPESNIVYVDSSQRVEGRDSNFLFEIKKTGFGKQFTYVSWLRCQIPKSYYTVMTGQNTFTVYVNGVPATVTLSAGRYNVRSFKTELETNLKSATGIASIVVTFPDSATEPQTGKYTISWSSGETIYFVFSGNRIAECMGFNKNSNSESSTSSLVSSNVVNLSGESTLFVHSDLCSNDGKDNILADVYASASNNFTNIVVQNQDPKADAKQIVNNDNSMYHFVLTDETGQEIELNGQNMLITLVLYSERDMQERSNRLTLMVLAKINEELRKLNEQIAISNLPKVGQKRVNLE